METSSETESTGYECELCSQIFPSKKEFIEHHVREGDDSFVCCNCGECFQTTSELFQHHQTHKYEQVVVEESNEFGDYTEQVEAVLNIPHETSIGSTSELLYILDDSQCVNEVVIEETGSQKSNVNGDAKPESFAIVQVDHGYIIPSVFKGQLSTKKRPKKKGSQNSDSDDTDSNNQIAMQQPRSRRVPNSLPKSRSVQPKRRHEVPDFSTPMYIIVNPNEDLDSPHYKCVRCEQLFISKFVFFRHVEKGKCYVNSCDICSAVFEKNSDFYEHYLVEHTDRAICNFCFRTFLYEKNVKEHMLRHLDQFRHRCEECNKGFYTVREYRNHYKNRHMGIRHKCDDCGRSFADEYYFKRHVATHNKQ